MSILEEIRTVLSPLGIPMETGVFSDEPPDEYIVVVPLSDTFDLHADNSPGIDIQEARISLYTRGSYTKIRNAAVKALLDAEFTVTARQYIGYETETGYHHYNVDAAKYYEREDE